MTCLNRLVYLTSSPTELSVQLCELSRVYITGLSNNGIFKCTKTLQYAIVGRISDSYFKNIYIYVTDCFYLSASYSTNRWKTGLLIWMIHENSGISLLC